MNTKVQPANRRQYLLYTYNLSLDDKWASVFTQKGSKFYINGVLAAPQDKKWAKNMISRKLAADKAANTRKLRMAAKVARMITRKEAISARQARKSAVVAEREKTKFMRLWNRSSFTFRKLSPAWKRFKAYKGYTYWFHGLLPDDHEDMLMGIMDYAAKMKIKVRLSIVDGYLLMETNKPAKARLLIAGYIYCRMSLAYNHILKG